MVILPNVKRMTVLSKKVLVRRYVEETEMITRLLAHDSAVLHTLLYEPLNKRYLVRTFSPHPKPSATSDTHQTTNNGLTEPVSLSFMKASAW